MSERPKLTLSEQIEWMKSKGITFNIYSEDRAIEFLKNSTYFFKLKAFDKDYTINPTTNKYKDLDFAYLVELSTLDMHLRRMILHATLDIEHFLKVRLLSRLSENDKEDGYVTVNAFFTVNPLVKDKILSKSENSVCKDLIEKIKRENYPIWNVVEVLSFGDFINLYDVYDQNYGGEDQQLTRCLFSVRCLRNAAAHNNCLLNNLRFPYTRQIRPSQYLSRNVSQVPGTHAKSREKKMMNPVIHDFVALLYVYRDIVTSQKTIYHFSQELHDLFDQRMLKHREYFQKNECVISAYDFVKKVIDALYPI